MDCCRVQWCDLLHCGNVVLPLTENDSFNLVFPSGLKALWKYEGFMSNFGLGQYDVTIVH